MPKLIIVVFVVGFALPLAASNQTCQFIEALDGDSLVVDCDGQHQQVHLDGLVAPPMVSGEDPSCMNHPMAEYARQLLANHFIQKKYQAVILQPKKVTSGNTQAELNAIVRVDAEYENKVSNHTMKGPLYAKLFFTDDGLSLDQFVKGYASLVAEHESWPRFASTKKLFTDTKNIAIESLKKAPEPFVYHPLPEVCGISPLRWKKLTVHRRCEIQKFCEDKFETNLDHVWEFINW